jgi:hypothetical protein
MLDLLVLSLYDPDDEVSETKAQLFLAILPHARVPKEGSVEGVVTDGQP